LDHKTVTKYSQPQYEVTSVSRLPYKGLLRTGDIVGVSQSPSTEDMGKVRPGVGAGLAFP